MLRSYVVQSLSSGDNVLFKGCESFRRRHKAPL